MAKKKVTVWVDETMTTGHDAEIRELARLLMWLQQIEGSKKWRLEFCDDKPVRWRRVWD